MAGTIVVDRIESDASYASNINVASQVTFSNTVNFGAFAGTAPVAGFYLPTTNNLAFTTASTERMRINSTGGVLVNTVTQTGSTKMVVADATGAGQIRAIHSTGLGLLINQATASGAAYINQQDNAALGFATNNTDVMSLTSTGLLQFNSGYGSVATAYGCRAWVNFNGKGVVAIRASGNVSSITDNGTGDYTINFTTTMSDANYGVTGSAGESTSPGGRIFEVKNQTAPTTSSVRVLTSNSSSTPTDYDFVSASIFR